MYPRTYTNHIAMPLTTTWCKGNRKGYHLASVTNPDGLLTGALLAASIKGIMDRLGPGYEMLVSVKLPAVAGPRVTHARPRVHPERCCPRRSRAGRRSLGG